MTNELTSQEVDSFAYLPEAPRDAFTPDELVAQFARLRAAAGDADTLAAIEAVLTETILRDAAGNAWSYSGWQWRRYDGASWVSDLPPALLGPQAAVAPMPPAPVDPFDVLATCAYCDAPLPSEREYCTACGANRIDPATGRWRCLACNVENAPELASCPNCDLRRPGKFPRAELLAAGLDMEPVPGSTGAPAVPTTPGDVFDAQPVVEAPAPVAMTVEHAPEAPVSAAETPTAAAPPALAPTPANAAVVSEVARAALPDTANVPTPTGDVDRSLVQPVSAGVACASCGADYTHAPRFCTICGRVFVAASMPQDVPASQPCTRCGAAVPDGNRFCLSCGMPVASVSSPPPAVCPACKAPFDPGVRFCRSCGTAVA